MPLYAAPWTRGSEANDFTQASNRFLVPGPITGQFVSTLNTSKPVVSGCGGGVLEVMVRSQITSSSSKPAYYMVDDPVPGERTWRVLTSLDIETC
jgi:hypothetical protein